MAHAAVGHDYHLVNPSPWPVVGSIGALLLAIGGVILMRGIVADPATVLDDYISDASTLRQAMAAGIDAVGEALRASQNFVALSPAEQGRVLDDYSQASAWWAVVGEGKPYVFGIGAVIMAFTCIGWWSDVIKESRAGDHTPVVDIGLRYGMILFIASEVMFFVAWFWMFFELAIFHDVRAGWTINGDPEAMAAWANWPPPHVETFDPFHLPLMNTLILLLSGTTVTWAHHALQQNDRKGATLGLLLTVLLGLVFSYIQFGVEYPEAGFHFGNLLGADPAHSVSTANVYGASFFMATGFHGAHVVIGTIFLAVCLLRLLGGGFTPQKHFGLEAAAWYWHFVDVVWLFLFTFVYVTPYLTMQGN